MKAMDFRSDLRMFGSCFGRRGWVTVPVGGAHVVHGDGHRVGRAA